jgi:hypothetical protein
MSNELVPIATAPLNDTPAGGVTRPHADFVAHLIATSAQAPQTRTRRRVTPAEAIAAYAALGQSTVISGRSVSRSL